MIRISARIANSLWLPALLMLLWLVVSAHSSSIYFPPLTNILSQFRKDWIFANIGKDVVPSVRNLLLGFILASISGVVLGLVIGLLPTLGKAVSPVIHFLRAIPPPILLPLAAVLLGLGTSMKVVMIAFGGVWPTLISTIDATLSVDPVVLDTARAYHIPLWTRLRRIVLPQASPRIAAGLRTSLQLCIFMVVVSEMFASKGGLGFFVLDAEQTFAIKQLWSGILMLGLLGIVANSAFSFFESRILRWYFMSQNK